MKGINDLQTEADRSAQRCIIASLSKAFPSLKIIGEEDLPDLNVSKEWLISDYDMDFLRQPCPEEWRDVQERDIVIWVDPLDGTAEYTQGYLDHVTVLVGMAIKDRAVGGVIHQPYYNGQDQPGQQQPPQIGRTIWGLKGLGVGGFPACLSPPSDQFIVTTTRSHFSETAQTVLDALKPTEVLKVGGAGYKVLLLLEGKAHAYVYPSSGCKKWDTCAPEAILEANGGILTDIFGEHYSYAADVDHPNRRGILASIGGNQQHKDIVRKLPMSVLNSLK